MNEQVQEGKKDTNELLIIAMVVILVMLIWVVFHSKLTAMAFGLRGLTLYLPSLVSSDAARALHWIRNVNPGMLDFAQVRQAMEVTGKMLLWLFIPLTMVLAIVNYMHRAPSSMRKKHSMQSLIEQEVKIWPTIAPAVYRPFSNKGKDIVSGPTAAALTEREFATLHKLINKFPERRITAYARRNGAIDKSGLIVGETLRAVIGSAIGYVGSEGWEIATQEKIIDENGVLNESRLADLVNQVNLEIRSNNKLNYERAEAVFISQLGPRWTGVKNLPPYMRAIMACLLERIQGDPKKASEISGQMALDYAQNGFEKMDFSWADAMLDTHCQSRIFANVLRQHAYVYTIFATLMQLTRNGPNPGVFPSCQFKWLKPVDRRLWYVLNNVGRYAFHVECAGIMAHWLTEKTVGRSIHTPCVGRAITYTVTEEIKNEKGKTEKTEKVIGGLEYALMEYCDDDSEKRIFY